MAKDTTEKLKLMQVPLAIAAAKEGTKNPTFSMVGYTGKQIKLWGFYNPVVIELSGLEIPSQRRPILLNHMNDPEYVMGQTDSIKVVDGQLIATGEIMGVSAKAKEVMELAAKGFEFQASIGAAITKREFVEAGQKAKANGQEFTGPINIIRGSRLGEISFVALGADDDTSANIAATYYDKPFEKENTMAKEEKVTAAADASQEAQAPAKVEAKAIDTEAIKAEAIKAERERLQQIEKICCKFPANVVGELKAKAVAGELTIDQLRAKMLDNLEASMPTIVTKTERQLDNNVLCAAAAMTSKSIKPETIIKAYGEQAVNEADKYRGIGVQDFFRLCARAEGRELPLMTRSGDDFIRAAFSTVSLPNILANVLRKALLAGYNYNDEAWRRICKIGTVSDFKTANRNRLNSDMKFQKVGADGELKHGTLGEQNFTIKADTRGIMVALTRQMIIDDDLSAFLQIPYDLGSGANDAIAEDVWSLILSNPSSFFTKTAVTTAMAKFNANHADGTDTALSFDAITTAEGLFLNQVKPNGRPLGINAKYIVVPPALKSTAEALMKSLEIRDTTANKKTPTQNIHAGKFEVVSSSYLSNSLYTGYSTTGWYLFADPNQIAAIEVAFLNGQDGPTIEQGETDFNTLGMQFRAYIDYGVKEQDPRGAVFMKGAS